MRIAKLWILIEVWKIFKKKNYDYNDDYVRTIKNITLYRFIRLPDTGCIYVVIVDRDCLARQFAQLFPLVCGGVFLRISPCKAERKISVMFDIFGLERQIPHRVRWIGLSQINQLANEIWITCSCDLKVEDGGDFAEWNHDGGEACWAMARLWPSIWCEIPGF